MERAWPVVVIVLAVGLAQALETEPARLFDDLLDESCNVCLERSSLWEQLIVRMQKYHIHNAVEGKIRAALGPISSKSWDWIPRNNAAMRFPTDFGVIRVDSAAREEIVSLLALSSDVKDTHSDNQIGQRRLLETEGVQEEDIIVPQIRGRRLTRWSFEEYEDVEYNVTASRRNLKASYNQRSITNVFNAEELWNKGIYGQNVKVAVFDTGVREDHPHFRKIKERTNWTHENTLNDGLGHGTFVAGVIASQDQQCAGFAPEAEIHAFRVFTNDQVSYTSWFLDAFNYAIATDMDVLNLSIGGPDYLDAPFVEKVWEVTANGIVMVSAIGNDGPLYGTLNNPADQADVIGVGGIDYNDRIAGFSSRGITTWELPHGIGRVKPDIVAYGKDVTGSRIEGGCRTLSGTSVASPVVAGAVTLICSSLPPKTVNPAMVKQALIETAQRLADVKQTEQGSGRLDLLEAQRALSDLSTKPKASVQPQVLDMTKQNCPYAWPYCAQPMYAGSMPTIVNLTLLNSMGVTGQVFQEPVFEPDNDASSGLIIQVTHSDVLWPWSGYLGLYISIDSSYSHYSGTMSGTLSLGIESPPGRNEESPRRSIVTLPIKVSVIPTPPREKRILWDIFHSVRYPPAYIPRDSLDVKMDILDWHGDHPFTNFHLAFGHLVDEGYFVEILSTSFTCFDASKYAALLLIDSEEEYSELEIEKLKNDIEERGLGVFVAADWYNVETMIKMRFFDDNTRSWWTPLTGGANVPALNDLLEPFGVSFSESILQGSIKLGSNSATFASGTSIARFPAGGIVHRASLSERSQSINVLKIQTNTKAGMHTRSNQIRGQNVDHPILGLLERGAGKLAVYGDSNCLDASHIVTPCFWLLSDILSWMARGQKSQALFSVPPLVTSLVSEGLGSSPHRRDDRDFHDYVGAVLQSVSVPGQGARISYRAGLLKPERDFCASNLTVKKAGERAGKSLTSDITYLESLNLVSMDKLYVAPIVESTQIANYVEVVGKVVNITKNYPESSASPDLSVKGEYIVDNPKVLDVKGTEVNGISDIEDNLNLFMLKEYETSLGLAVAPTLGILGGISLLLMWNLRKKLRTPARRGSVPRLLDV